MSITIGDAILWIRGDTSKLGPDLRGAEGKANSFLGNLSKGITQGFGLAIGTTILNWTGQAIGGLFNLGKAALSQIASFEKLELSMQALVARELARTSAVEQSSTITRQATLDELLLRERLATQIAAQEATLAKLSKTQGASSLEAQKAARDLATLQNQFAALGFVEGDMIQVTTKWTERTMTMAEALEAAGPRAKELLDWITQLAIKSPFDQEGVAIAFRTALAYGFTSEQAQRLTQNMIDFASATGGSTDQMNSIALALGQIQAKGKLAGQEILQLVNAGVPVNDILNKMGFTLDDVSKGLVSADEFLEAFNQTMEEDVGGAAERQSQTWAGLLNTLGDLKNIGLREFFGGIFEAAQPVVALLADWLQEEGLARLQEYGAALGVLAEEGIGRLMEAVNALQEGDVQGVLAALFGPEKAQEIMDFLAQFDPLKESILNLFSAFQESGPEAQVAWEEFWANAKQVAGDNMPQIIENVSSGVNSLAEWWRKHDTEVIAIVTGTLNVLISIFGGGITLITGLLSGGVQILTGDWEGGMETLKKSWVTFADGILKHMDTTWGEVEDSWTGVFDLLGIILEDGSQKLLLDFSLWILDLLAKFDEWALSMSDKGWDLINGLKEGVEGAWEDFSSWLIDLAQQLIADFLATLGIHSPSTVFAAIGENIGLGLAEGIKKSTSKVEDSFNKLIEGLFGAGRTLGGLGSFAAKRWEETVIDPLKDELASIEDQIEDADNFYEIIALNAKRKELIDEIAAQEEKILALQEKQAQLDFLSRQFELLKLIQENGLNPEDILGGMELGINASLEGLIEAMTNAMGALVEQAQDELGIHSPSRVFEGMGQQIMAGLGRGLQQGLGFPAQVLNAMAPALTGTLSNVVRNNYFTQNIVNNFPTDPTGRGFGMMRALAGA